MDDINEDMPEPDDADFAGEEADDFNYDFDNSDDDEDMPELEDADDEDMPELEDADDDTGEEKIPENFDYDFAWSDVDEDKPEQNSDGDFYSVSFAEAIDEDICFLRNLIDEERGKTDSDDEDSVVVPGGVPADKLSTTGNIKMILNQIAGAMNRAINDDAVTAVADEIADAVGFPKAIAVQIPRIASCVLSVRNLSKEEAKEILLKTLTHVMHAFFAYFVYSLMSTCGLTLAGALAITFKNGVMKSALLQVSKSKEGIHENIQLQSQIDEVEDRLHDVVAKLKRLSIEFSEESIDEIQIDEFEALVGKLKRLGIGFSEESSDEVHRLCVKLVAEIDAAKKRVILPIKGSVDRFQDEVKIVNLDGNTFIQVKIKHGETIVFCPGEINETIKTALTYSWDKKCDEKRILILDLSGGNFHVSILTIDDGVFEVLERNGDIPLAGDQTDQIIIECFIKLIKGITKYSTKNSSAPGNLLREIESLIEELNHSSEPLTNTTSKEWNNLFRKAMGPVKEAMEDACMGHQIDEVVIIGGSTRIPIFQQLLMDYFNGKEPTKNINPDQGKGKESKDILSAHLSLGIETVEGIMTKLIPRKTLFPSRKSQLFTTYQNWQTSVCIEVYEGDSNLTNHCVGLGKFNLTGIPPALRGIPLIRVTFDVDAKGILNVKAEDRDTGKSRNITINNKGRLSQEEIDHMVKEAVEVESVERQQKKVQ